MRMKTCPTCGEKYSDTYRYCPFCEEMELEKEGRQVRRRGGRRSGPRQEPNLIGPILIGIIIILVLLLIYLFFGEIIADKLKPSSSQEPGSSSAVSSAPSSSSAAEPPAISIPDPVIPEPAPPANPMDLPTTLTLSNPDFTFKQRGETTRLRVNGGDGGTYTWYSDNEKVATVNSEGVVTAVGAGIANIIAYSDSGKGVAIARCRDSVGVSSDPVTPSAPSTTTPSTTVPSTTTPSTTTPSTSTPSTPSSGGTLKTGKATVINGGNGVRVRSGPGTNYDALATIPNGGSVTIVEKADGDWYKVTFSDVGGVTSTGYMKGEFLANS